MHVLTRRRIIFSYFCTMRTNLMVTCSAQNAGNGISGLQISNPLAMRGLWKCYGQNFGWIHPWQHLSKDHSFQFLQTRRLNQDALENVLVRSGSKEEIALHFSSQEPFASCLLTTTWHHCQLCWWSWCIFDWITSYQAKFTRRHAWQWSDQSTTHGNSWRHRLQTEWDWTKFGMQG